MTVIDDYLVKIEPSKRKGLERIRKIVLKTVPDAKEIISYNMPTFTYKGKAFLGFALRSNHIGIYPYGGEEIEVFKEKLSDFGFSKGTIRVPFNKQFPEDVLEDIIRHRINRIEK